jgi:cell division transport system ATP-binding protein
VIALEAVGKRYPGGQQALRGITLDIAAGEFAVVTGASGAGKSTLLKLIAALELPSEGRVRVGGQDTAASRRALPYLRRRFGMVFQDHKLLHDRSAFDNVLLPLEVSGFPRREAVRRVRAALDRVGLLGRERALPVTLSGGEQQRLAIARAIVHRPALLVADEPTANVDARYARDIVEILASFHAVGVTVVLATHDRQGVGHLRPRVIELVQGGLA